MDHDLETQTTEARDPVLYIHRGTGGHQQATFLYLFHLPLSYLLRAFEGCFGMVVMK